MALFSNAKVVEAMRTLNQQLITVIADLRDELNKEREASRKEREELLNKIVALSNTPAYRVMNPVMVPERAKPAPQRPHVPGMWPPPPRIDLQEAELAAALVDKVAKSNGS